jgi:hypothetical protein
VFFKVVCYTHPTIVTQYYFVKKILCCQLLSKKVTRDRQQTSFLLISDLCTEEQRLRQACLFL